MKALAAAVPFLVTAFAACQCSESAPSDAGVDSGLSVGLDAGIDAGPAGGIDAGTDAGGVAADASCPGPFAPVDSGPAPIWDGGCGPDGSNNPTGSCTTPGLTCPPGGSLTPCTCVPPDNVWKCCSDTFQQCSRYATPMPGALCCPATDPCCDYAVDGGTLACSCDPTFHWRCQLR